MTLGPWTVIGWVVGASLLGFAVSAVFAGRMKLSRNLFLIPYVSLVLVFLAGFVVANKVDVGALLRENWVWGVVAGVVVSVFLVRNVQSQPASRQVEGAALARDMVWTGLVYGLMDALLLNVMPVVATQMAAARFDWAETGAGKTAVAVAGLLASLLVTLAYHVGYPEFRNKSVTRALVGNSVITLAFILSGNPLGSIIGHAVMHVAAVLQGAETTAQLPPHFQPG
jgi:hypothetical protein